MKLRRSLVSAALVAAVVSPAAVLSAAPAFAESASAAQTRSDDGSIAELERAAADAAKAYTAAVANEAKVRAEASAFLDNSQPYLGKYQEAKAAAAKAAAAKDAANKEAEEASRAYGSATEEDLPKARERMLKAIDAANAAIAADAKAKADVTAARNAMDDARVEAFRRIHTADQATKAAATAKAAADKALADARAAAEKPVEKPVEQPVEKPVEQPAAVTPVSDTTTNKSTTATKTTAANKSTSATTTQTATGSATELAETGSNPATPYLALGSGLAISLGAAALYVSRRKPARSAS
ncbi:LAETG motif-containing sortase-dependent surface protein [Kitasatospora sp. NPDC057542]|uniref:LPXTG cell wall anchor domain-containing protein n=1 Tax=Streptomycetaceae TaxID=2062 RepID=UPI001CC98D24|nr:LPXTG cell wall anchor domain-containing protein [Streptomyces sp. LS1784]